MEIEKRSMSHSHGEFSKSMSRTITMQLHTHSYHYCSEMNLGSRFDLNFDKVSGAWNIGQRQQVMVHAPNIFEDNNYARFHTHSHHVYREMYFNSRLDIKFWQRQWTLKCGSVVPLHGACLKSVKDNYFVRFHTHSYHCYREMQCISRLNSATTAAEKWT